MVQSPSHILASGTPEGFDATIVLREVAQGGVPVLHVARDDKRMAAMARALAFFDPSVPVLHFPGWDCLPYDRVSPNPEISAARMATLAGLAGGLSGAFIVLTTLNAATQYVPPRDLLRASAFVATVGGRLDESALKTFLVRMGFSQTPTVTEPGDYAVRGGIIDVWPPGEAGPVRLDLFGDVLDGARRFDPASQRTTEKLERVELAPVSEVVLDEAAITRFRQNYRIEFGAAGTDDPLYEAVSAGRKHQGVEHWLPFFHERLETIFDYLPGARITLDDQTTPQRLARWETISDQYDTRKTALTQKGGWIPSTSRFRPVCSILMTRYGTAPPQGTAWCNSRPSPPHPVPASSTWAGALGAISRLSGRMKPLAFSVLWRSMLRQNVKTAPWSLPHGPRARASVYTGSCRIRAWRMRTLSRMPAGLAPRAASALSSGRWRKALAAAA